MIVAALIGAWVVYRVLTRDDHGDDFWTYFLAGFVGALLVDVLL